MKCNSLLYCYFQYMDMSSFFVFYFILFFKDWAVGKYYHQVKCGKLQGAHGHESCSLVGSNSGLRPSSLTLKNNGKAMEYFPNLSDSHVPSTTLIIVADNFACYSLTFFPF